MAKDPTYDVYVENIGCVCSTGSHATAIEVFDLYCTNAKYGVGRVGTWVVILRNGDMFREFQYPMDQLPKLSNF